MAKKARKSFSTVSDVLSSKHVSRKLSSLIEEYRLKSLWQDVVGEKLSERTEPHRLYNGLLTVNVANSVLSNQLHFLKEDILKKIRKVASGLKVEDLKFQVRNVTKRVYRSEVSEIKPALGPKVEISPEDQKILDSGPFDRETKEILKRILVNAKNRKRGSTP